MDDPKQSLPALLGEMERLLREQVEAAELFATRGREILDQMFGKGSTPRPNPTARKPRRYAHLEPLQAACIFLEERGRPVTEKEIVEELLDGKVKTGSDKLAPARVAGNIKRSLFQNSKTSRSTLIKIDDRYGLRSWSKEILQLD